MRAAVGVALQSDLSLFFGSLLLGGIRGASVETLQTIERFIVVGV